MKNPTRREFLHTSLLAAGGLVLGSGVTGCMLNTEGECGPIMCPVPDLHPDKVPYRHVLGRPLEFGPNVAQLTCEALDEFKRTYEYGVVDFWAPWCGPCRELKPYYEETSGEEPYRSKIAFGSFDIDQEGGLDKFLLEGHTSIPAIIMYKDGVKTSNTYLGNWGKDYLYVRLDEFLIGREPQVLFYPESVHVLRRKMEEYEVPTMVRFTDYRNPYSFELDRSKKAIFERAASLDYYQAIKAVEIEKNYLPEAFLPEPEGFGVVTTPCVIFFKEGREHLRLEGPFSDSMFYSTLEDSI